MISGSQRRATEKWFSNPENRRKHNEICKQAYRKKKRAMYEKHADAIVALGGDREAVIEYLFDNLNLKSREG